MATASVHVTGLRGNKSLHVPDAPDDVEQAVLERAELDNIGTIPSSSEVGTVEYNEDTGEVVDLQLGEGQFGPLLAQEHQPVERREGERTAPQRRGEVEPGQATLEGGGEAPETQQRLPGATEPEPEQEARRRGREVQRRRERRGGREEGQLGLDTAAQTQRLGAFGDGEAADDDGDDGADTPDVDVLAQFDDDQMADLSSGQQLQTQLGFWDELPRRVNGWELLPPGRGERTVASNRWRYVGVDGEAIRLDERGTGGMRVNRDPSDWRMRAAYYDPRIDRQSTFQYIVDMSASQADRARRELVEWMMDHDPGTYVSTIYSSEWGDTPPDWHVWHVQASDREVEVIWRHDRADVGLRMEGPRDSPRADWSIRIERGESSVGRPPSLSPGDELWPDEVAIPENMNESLAFDTARELAEAINERMLDPETGESLSIAQLVDKYGPEPVLAAAGESQFQGPLTDTEFEFVREQASQMGARVPVPIRAGPNAPQTRMELDVPGFLSDQKFRVGSLVDDTIDVDALLDVWNLQYPDKEEIGNAMLSLDSDEILRFVPHDDVVDAIGGGVDDFGADGEQA